MKKILWIVEVGFLVVLELALPAAARASDSLRQGVDELAGRILAVLEEERADSIAVGEFTGDPNPPTSSGPGIQRLLIQALRAKKVTVKEEANLTVKGEYLLERDAKDKQNDRYLIKLEATVRNKKTNKKWGDLQAEIRGNDDIAKLVAATVNLESKSEADAGDRAEVIKKAIVEPGVFIEGSTIKASKDANYSVEILVGGKGRPAEKKKGQAFVPLNNKDIYVVRVFNPGPHNAAVSLTIDGLDVFAFSEVKNKKTGQPKYKHFIVGPRQHLNIPGWHCNNKVSKSFQVVDFKHSALAQVSTGSDARLLKARPALGTLTVCFHVAWDAGKPPPAGAREARGSSGTGFGPPVSFELKEVHFSVGVLREAVSIRYDKQR